MNGQSESDTSTCDDTTKSTTYPIFFFFFLLLTATKWGAVPATRGERRRIIKLRLELFFSLFCLRAKGVGLLLVRRLPERWGQIYRFYRYRLLLLLLLLFYLLFFLFWRIKWHKVLANNRVTTFKNVKNGPTCFPMVTLTVFLRDCCCFYRRKTRKAQQHQHGTK